MAKTKAQAYIMVAGPFIKVGMTNNIENRMKAIDTACPYPLQVIWLSGWMLICDARNLELNIQDRLREYCVKGEWFKVNHPTAIKTAEDMKSLLFTSAS